MALLILILGLWWYHREEADEVAVSMAPQITEFTCTAARVEGSIGAVECFEGTRIVLSGVLVDNVQRRSALELLVIGDALACQRLGRHESGATLARCATSTRVDIACALDPVNIPSITPLNIDTICPARPMR